MPSSRENPDQSPKRLSVGKSVLESVIALKPANCPEPIAKCRASVPTRLENPVMASRPGECVKVAV